MQSKEISKTCEEASMLSLKTYIPCGRPAEFLVQPKFPDEGPYAMCDMCTDHNVNNRGASIVRSL